MAGLTECTFINPCTGKIDITFNYFIYADDNGWTFLQMFCERESLCVYQTKLMYNDEILDHAKTLIEQCDNTEHKLTFQVIKMHNEIILMKDVEWCIENTKDGEYKIVLLPSAKIININCNGVIIRNVIDLRCIDMFDGGFGISYKEHTHSLKHKCKIWYELPGDVPVNITGDLSEFEMMVETMSEFFIQIIDPTFHDHNVQTKIDNELAAEALYASYNEENKIKFDEYKMKCKRRREERLKAEGYKT